MKVNHKDKFLAKKVLLSVVAAGVMSGFVLSAEAANEIRHEDGKNYQYDTVDAERVTANNASVIELNGGKVAGVKVEHQDKDDDRVGYADEAAASDKDSKIIANDVAFTGEVRAGEGGTVILNGGSVTSGTFYYTDAQGAGVIEDYSTEIGSRGEGSYVELNKVKLDTNLGAFEGGMLTVNDSNVNADTAIYAEGGTINLNSTDGNAKYTVGISGVEARDGGVININGGGTFASDSYLRCLPMQAFDGSTINVDSGKNKTTINAVVKLFSSEMNITGDVEIADGDITVRKLNDSDKGSTFTVKENSKLTANGISVDDADCSFIANGSVAIKEIHVSSGANATFKGAESDIYTVSDSITTRDGSKVYIYGGTLKADNLKDLIQGNEKKSIVLDKNGVISTVSDQIYAKAASATQKESGEITNEDIDFKGGSLVLNDEKYTLSYTNSAKAELKKQGATKLTMTGKLIDESTGEVKDTMSVDKVADNAGSDVALDKTTATTDNNLLVGATGDNSDGTDKVENGFAVGSLDIGKDADTVTITNDKEVTLGGSQGGSLVTAGGEEKDVKIVVGSDAAGTEKFSGSLNIGNSLATDKTQYKLNGEITINKDSKLKINGQTEITKALSLNDADLHVEKGSLKTADLNISGKSNVAGAVNADSLNVLDKDTIINIGNQNAAGSLVIGEVKLNGGTLFLDPVWQDGATISDASGLAVTNISALDGAYVAGQNSKLAFGTDLAAVDKAFAKSGATWGKNGITAAAYINSTIDVSGGSITVDGELTSAPTAPENGSVKLAKNSMLMVNGENINETTAAITGADSTKVEIDSSSKLYIDNAEKDKTYKIIDGSTAAWSADNILSNNKLLNLTFDATNNTVSTTSKSVKEAYGTAIFAGNVYDAAIAAGGVAADFVNNASDDHHNADDAAKISALNSAASMGELAGVEHGTYAASNLFSDAVAEHMSLESEKEHDSDIWAKYVHSKENIDGLAIAGADSKYDATFNGVVVGADLYKNGKATVGAALSYVDGSIKGNTLAANTKNDATYYGASIYGGIQNDDSAVIGDISYLHGKNEITQHNSGMALTADAKSDAFSVGVRAEKAVKAGAGKFVPYAGLRYMHLGTGNYTNSIGMSYDGDDMNLWLLPVGVKYSADVKAGGWTIRQIAEVGYVWNMGDRDATQTVSLNGASDGFGYDVTDNGSYIGRFVVEAEKANVTYGLGYEYQKGDSVKANKWMANINWNF